MLQIAGMKLETDTAPPVQRHSAPTAATTSPQGPVTKHVTAALRQSAPAVKVASMSLHSICQRLEALHATKIGSTVSFKALYMVCNLYQLEVC